MSRRVVAAHQMAAQHLFFSSALAASLHLSAASPSQRWRCAKSLHGEVASHPGTDSMINVARRDW